MNPSKLFAQKGYEKIVYVVRRHWITFLPVIIFFLVLLAIPAGLYWLILNTLNVLLQNLVYYTTIILLASIYYLSVVLFFYTYFVTFHLDLWVVTNDRLLDVEQKTLFSRTVSEVDLYQIQDASSEVSGFFPSIFNYGNLSLQTAGPEPKFIFRNVSNPNKLREAILNLAAEDKKYHEKQ